MTATIVCFGDSNTHGADPIDGTRLARGVRWPGVLRASLGDGYEVIEEGLNGRTTVWDSALAPHHNGSTYLTPCLLTHAPVDLIIIMLGTNDLKAIYRLGAAEIASGAGALVDQARQSLAGPEGMPPRVLLVAPVPLGSMTERSEVWGFGASLETSRQLAAMYRVVADGKGVAFLDAGSVARISPLDGVHLDPQAHAGLGTAMADAVREANAPA
ncbi:MAG: SGNH/GDSL hydrolase family protein [Chloroflexota bacterium]